jgi:hypothetical protein
LSAVGADSSDDEDEAEDGAGTVEAEAEAEADDDGVAEVVEDAVSLPLSPPHAVRVSEAAAVRPRTTMGMVRERMAGTPPLVISAYPMSVWAARGFLGDAGDPAVSRCCHTCG